MNTRFIINPLLGILFITAWTFCFVIIAVGGIFKALSEKSGYYWINLILAGGCLTLLIFLPVYFHHFIIKASFLKIENNRILVARLIRLTWQEINIKDVLSADYDSSWSKQSILTIKILNINRFNEVEVPAFFSRDAQRAAEYINLLVKDQGNS